ncbi:MAG: hypothetical protein BGO21_04600 [Dyadobacter sp. 50-39]|uniref:hypothetical protein n=1 Tax=Dyadobacter sp. 50-39 TaxID=1895756 RepID=UPI0009651B98|nr:hypothetical protein [Dyadobacter sp. 50-39]OJV13015.1 MAG: hypothetical protein BGO21_04600 [Dyadobacter sp. 50-39]
MKTFTIFHEGQKVGLSRLLAILILPILLFGGSCDQREVKEYEPGGSCFTKEFLENEAWVRAELTWFQQPKMGSLRVAVYRYKSDYYLAFENGFTSGPIGHIFDCSGKHLGELNINYNEFYDNNELMTVLLDANY